MEAKTTIQKGAKIGSGGYGHVFRAVESATNRVVALKQSRASLHLKRPLLQHEARVLQLLSGHPSIPEVYAYGRIGHFELMTMQLLHRSLGDVVKEGGPLGVKTVAVIACQMISALEHIHSHRLVHRDIKPSNIMLQGTDSWRLCLIDFGLARPLSNSLTASIHPMRDSGSILDKPVNVSVFGTLPFASLNAHGHEPRLTYRDDFESLAYTLLWLLRGNLPWSDYVKRGTDAGRIRQVLAQKKRHAGMSLCTDLPVEFGELLDYARSLFPDQKPNYQDWGERFVNVEPASDDSPPPERPTLEVSVAFPEPPLEIGQVVLVKLDACATVDGYTIREGHESSFIPDPLLSSPEWSTAYRPAVIAKVEWNQRRRKYSFFAIPISRKANGNTDNISPVVPILTSASGGSKISLSVLMGPEWPLGGAYFYVFKRPVKFYCLPSQEKVPVVWRVSASDCGALLDALTPAPDSPLCSQLREELKSTKPDIRYDARLRRLSNYCRLYAQVSPLTLAHIHDDSIDWYSNRAWFDECVKMTRYNHLNNGIWWTGAWFPPVYIPKEGDLSDSYSESDYSLWQAQSERRRSITLPTSDEAGEGQSSHSWVRQWEAAGAHLAESLATYVNLCSILSTRNVKTKLDSHVLVSRIDYALETLYVELEQKIAHSRRTLIRTRNKLAGIFYTIPEEILAKIFTFVVCDRSNCELTCLEDDISAHYRRLHSLMGVCSVWRRVGTSHGALWTLIPMTSRKSGWMNRLAAERSYERAGGREIHLAASIEKGVGAAFINNIELNFSRFRSINIVFQGKYQLYRAIPSLFKRELPSIALNELSLYRFFEYSGELDPDMSEEYEFLTSQEPYLPSPISIHQTMQSLRILRLKNVYIHWQIINLPNLVELRVEWVMLGSKANLMQFLLALHTAPQLQKLELISLSTEPDPEGVFPSEPIAIPLTNLQTLHLGDLYADDTETILCSINPGSYHLSLNLTVQMATVLLAQDEVRVGLGGWMSALQGAKVDTLLLQGDEIWGNWLNPDEFHSLLSRLPSIETLKVDFWVFGNSEWEALTRPTDYSPFAKLRSLQLTNIHVRLDTKISLEKCLFSHPIQHLTWEGMIEAPRQASDIDWIPIKASDQIVGWLRSKVPNLRLVRRGYVLPDFRVDHWELW